MFFIVASGFKLYFQYFQYFQSETEVSMELIEETDKATPKMLRKNSENRKEPQLSKQNQFEMKYSNVDYRVAMSNGLFNDSAMMRDLPCQNCKLILMGSMACYQGKCPECGKVPPNYV